MAKCNNCGKKLGCSCQRRTLPNGKPGCTNCMPKTSPKKTNTTGNHGQILGVTAKHTS